MNFNQLSSKATNLTAPVNLSDIISDVAVVQMFGPHDVGVSGITTDSREVRDRSLFVAVEGASVDGHDFVQRAIEQGAGTVVIQLRQYEAGLKHLLSAAYAQHNETTVVIVENSRDALAILADRFHRSPSKKLRLVGITGTNGKTTTSCLIDAVLRAAGERTGLIGTVEYRIGRTVIPASLTTPQAVQLHALFADMVAAGCTSAVMEVSSHALALDRVKGIGFDISIFTNLTRDHLDFHTDMEDYAAAKALLFSRHTRGTAVVNIDDPAGARMRKACRRPVVTYGTSARAAVRIMDIRQMRRLMEVDVTWRGAAYTIVSPLTGRFNAFNLTAAFAACAAAGIAPGVILKGLRSVKSVPGRFERIVSRDGVTAIVDYSHTPDSLQNALATASALPVRSGRVIVVFGCGGDRDQGKRPLMGAIASEHSDIAIVTSDNPRTESPRAIIDAIVAGMTGAATQVVRVQREKAIRHAVRIAKPGDVILVAGKGHETYQIIGRKQSPFDDREVVRRCFDELRGGVGR